MDKVKEIKDRMDRLAALNTQMEIEKDRIAELHGQAVYCGQILKKTPGVKQWDKDKLGKITAQLCELEKKHIATLQEFERKQAIADDWYSSIPDSIYKQALYWFFFKGLTWQQVQRKLGNNKSADALRMGVNKLLTDCEPPEI